MAARVEYIAVVYPEDNLAKFEIDRIARTFTDFSIESMFATEAPEAKAWLRIKT